MTDYPPGATHGPRTLSDFEFIWLVSGSAVLSTSIDEVALDVGVLYLVGPGRRHLLSWDRDRPTRHGYVHFGIGSDAPAVALESLRARPFTVEDPLAAMCRYLCLV
jgi:AraC family transcriptional regulator